MALDDLVEGDDEIQSEDYFEAAWGEGVWEGERWSLPYIGSIRILYFNIDLFEEIKVSPVPMSCGKLVNGHGMPSWKQQMR